MALIVRLVPAFLRGAAASAALCALFALAGMLFQFADAGGAGDADFSYTSMLVGPLLLFLGVFAVALAVALVLGTPALWLLNALGANRWYVAVPLGAATAYWLFTFLSEFTSPLVGPYFAFNGGLIAWLGWRALARDAPATAG